MQTEKEKNISDTQQQVEDRKNNTAESKGRKTVAVYCRLGSAEQLRKEIQIDEIIEERRKSNIRLELS